MEAFDGGQPPGITVRLPSSWHAGPSFLASPNHRGPFRNARRKSRRAVYKGEGFLVISAFVVCAIIGDLCDLGFNLIWRR
jgi:hypothetical protein